MGIAYRYIAMCDVLGFSALVQRTPLVDLDQMYDQLMRVTREHTEIRIHTLTRSEGYKLRTEQVPWVVFSDTLLLWADITESEEESWRNVCNLFEVIGALIAVSANVEMPLRVGVAFGESLVDPTRNRYLGLPIVDAYRTEEAQNWFGGACHPSCYDAPFFKNILNPDLALVVPFDVPLHDDSKIMLPYAVNWVDWAYPGIVEWLTKQAQLATDESVARKYRAALRFYQSAPSTLQA